MGWFKKEETKMPVKQKDSIPRLPELPKLPELEGFDSNTRMSQDFTQPSMLPSFPRNDLGNKFSQHTIKNAISGQEEDDTEIDYERNMADFEEKRMMPINFKKPLTRELEEDFPEEDEYAMETENSSQRYKPMARESSMPMIPFKKTIKEEPIFIRLDKFEETVKTFEKAKHQINEIEEMLSDIRKLKEKEEAELASWEQEIQLLKRQVEKIDKEIFSKLE